MSNESFRLWIPEELPELTEEEHQELADGFMLHLLDLCSKPARMYCTTCDDYGHGAEDHG